MKVAFVHDYLIQYGGAERVLESLCNIWPHAPIYTLVHEPRNVYGKFDSKTVRTSFIQKLPFAKSHHRLFPPLMMLGIEQFQLDYYDVVISDSSSFAKNIITKPGTLHICYCHTPMRYAWDDCQYYTEEFSFPAWLKKIIPYFMNYIRVWDYYASNGVDHFIANSNFVKRRIDKYYHRDSEVINPPVETDKFSVKTKGKIGDYYLLVGRMMKYKKMDLVIEAFNENGFPLKVVGRGMEYKRLRKMAGNNIEFLGRVPDRDLSNIYSAAQAFIFPQEEDFGIVAIEALASGRPVIAYQAGDIQENIIDGQTGIFFKEQTADSLNEAIKKFQRMSFDSEFIRNQALKFDRRIFEDKIRRFVEEKWREKQNQEIENVS